jgi:Ca2+-binding RTX toxin-like protein
MANIIGTDGNDTLVGTNNGDAINGKTGNDTITGSQNNDILTGGGGKDKFVYNLGDGTDTITDFAGVGKGTNPTAAVIAEVDTLVFKGAGFTARNLLLTQNGTNLEIAFEGVDNNKVILQDFKLEDLHNLKASGTTPAIGNILFNGQTSITDSFNVLDANSTHTSIGIKNTVTFLNDLDNNIKGLDNSDDVINGQGGNDKIDGLSGNDLLRGGTGNNTLIGGAGNDTLNIDNAEGSNLLDGGDGNDYLSVYDNYYGYATSNNTLNGGAGNDYLTGGSGNDSLYGGGGNDYLTGGFGDDTLTGGRGKDQFVYNLYDYTDTITDFGGVGKGTNPTAAVIAEVDTLKFIGTGLTARNLLLTQNGTNLEIAFEGVDYNKVILKDFKLEDLDNLKASGTRPAIGNILFNGQTSITDSFNVLDANSTDTSIGIKNTVTFLNDLDNNIKGLDNSDDVINGQGGNDKIDGLSGNDLLRGGSGNNTLNGGAGDDTLSATGSTGDNLLFGGAGNDSLKISGASTGDNLLFGDAGNDSLDISGEYSEGYYNSYLSGHLVESTSLTDTRSLGNNTLDGGAGDDTLSASGSRGDNLLSGGTGNDYLNISGQYRDYETYKYEISISKSDTRTLGNNTLNGGAGDDTLSASGSKGDNLLNGGDGNDYLNISGYYFNYTDITGNSSDINDTRSLGNNTLKGGAGSDILNVANSTGDNLLNGDDGNDTLLAFSYDDPSYNIASGNNTLNGGAGNDILNVDNSRGDNLLDGGDGNDTLSASSYDNPYGASGNNTLNGGASSDRLIVDFSTGKNLLSGGDGNDTLSASNASGNNTLNGGNGNDYLTGGNSNDSLIGGVGTDTFAFNSFNEGLDTIYDFNATNERIRVSAAGFGGGLSIGSLKTSQFTIGTSATTAAQRFIYTSSTGALFFDQDGSAGAFSKVQFAQLSTGLSLTNNNFVVV